MTGGTRLRSATCRNAPSGRWWMATRRWSKCRILWWRRRGQARSEGVPARARPSSSPPQSRTAQATPPTRSPTPRPASGRPAGAVVSSPPDLNKVFSAPMPGVILSVAVNPGDQVVTGDVICVLEAMKMQQNLRAEWSGIIKSVLVAVGEQVMEGRANSGTGVGYWRVFTPILTFPHQGGRDLGCAPARADGLC